MRLSVAKFFLAGDGGLVGSGDSLVLDCYRLAKFYGTSPEIFLNMPLSEVDLHLHRTIQLSERMRREQQQED